MSSTILGSDGKARCRWCAVAPEFLDYHDTEWGFPVADDRRLFEKLSLEGFQSGLSWPTTVYAFMQAMGLVNDHVHECVIRTRVASARKKFDRP